MKFFVICAILCAYLSSCSAFSMPILFNKRIDVTINGTTTSYCEFEGVRFLPDIQLNLLGNCGLWYCSKKFDIHITPCDFDSKWPRKICVIVFITYFCIQRPVNLNGLIRMTRNFIQNAVELKNRLRTGFPDFWLNSWLARVQLWTVMEIQ